jgi:putative transposase
MMYADSKKLAIIRMVEESELSVRRTLQKIKVSRTSFYRWYRAYEERGLDSLENQSRAVRQRWNWIPDSVRALIFEVALERPDLTPRELAWHITDTHDYLTRGHGPGAIKAALK